MNKWVDIRTDERMHNKMYGWKNIIMDGWMNGCIHGWQAFSYDDAGELCTLSTQPCELPSNGSHFRCWFVNIFVVVVCKVLWAVTMGMVYHWIWMNLRTPLLSLLRCLSASIFLTRIHALTLSIFFLERELLSIDRNFIYCNTLKWHSGGLVNMFMWLVMSELLFI